MEAGYSTMMANTSPHHFSSHGHIAPQIDHSQLGQFRASTTSHLRNLSNFAQDADGDDLAIRSKDQEVTGLHGRRRLQRGNSVRVKNTRWATWADQKRKHIQAYEYLCHIGEAKEWIETITSKSIPPIVQLEESLRDGIILAEVVQALFPDKRLRIWRGPGLTWRHTENIAIFFRLLEEFELPDLFFFELVDLYEKKNIPKVIYCIHSLSWLLWRNGVTDFRIGNLVGRLDFEEHELEATQKSLDRAGLNLPNFSGMGASFGVEPEPVETEEERIDRELGESEALIHELQAQARGAMLRMRLGNMMQQFCEVEASIIALQSKVRGDMGRAIFQYRLDMVKFAINLQSAARGFLARSRAREASRSIDNIKGDILVFQSLFRGFKQREKLQTVKTQLRKQDHGIREFQAAIRGALLRRDIADDYDATRQAEPIVESFQALIRGTLVRKHAERQRNQLQNEAQKVEYLQSAIRGMFQRKAMHADMTSLRQEASMITKLQAAAMGYLKRHSIQETKDELERHSDIITKFQSISRSFMVRTRILATMALLKQQQASILSFQSAVRGFILRQKTFDRLCELNEQESSIISLQSQIHGMLCRNFVGNQLMELETWEPNIVEFQAWARGKMIRTRFEEKMRHYKENMEKVVKIQSFMRARQQGEAYKVITSGKNPPVKTVKNFVHLLNDSDFDFEEEMEFERLRKTIVHRVRENEQAEQYIDQLDIKIALLVKNKITLDEVIRHQKHFGGTVGNLLTNKNISSKDPFDLKALNKDSRNKLEHYQELFFLLQTQPQYLACLVKLLRDKGLPEPEQKKIGLLIMGIFGFAQKRREEYYLLKLMARSIQEELGSCETLQDYQRGSFFWAKILSGYTRSPTDRKFLHDLLGDLIKQEIIDNEDLDLESDPIQIYRSAINNEELRNGQRSRRPADITQDQAIRDPETREMFTQRLQDLCEISDRFFACLEQTLPRMPYGIRYVAQQTFQKLCTKFPYESQNTLLKLVGHWLWKAYIQPALLQPDTWGVIDRGLSPLQKRNLGEISKVVNQIAMGQLFDRNNILERINPYIAELQGRVEEIWKNRKPRTCRISSTVLTRAQSLTFLQLKRSLILTNLTIYLRELSPRFTSN
jgi:Ras GTPase-activating-like protein IQGAP2/3